MVLLLKIQKNDPEMENFEADSKESKQTCNPVRYRPVLMLNLFKNLPNCFQRKSKIALQVSKNGATAWYVFLGVTHVTCI